jgi:hypothetical protein
MFEKPEPDEAEPVHAPSRTPEHGRGGLDLDPSG